MIPWWPGHQLMATMASSSVLSILHISLLKPLILLSRSTSDGLHGGSAFGIICSVSSSILWLTHVMQVVYLVFRFVLYLLDMLKGGNGGGVMGWGCALWSG